MEIVVQLSPQVAAEFADPEQASPSPDALVPGLTDLGLSLEPMHPGESDPALSAYFTTVAPNPEEAQRAIETLRASDAVEAAYIKPPAEAP